MSGTRKTIRERISPDAMMSVQASDINEAEGFIDNVTVCGPVSENGRDYPTKLMERCYTKYENAVVNFDHIEGVGQRRFDDRGGWLSNVRLGEDKRPRARLNVLKSDSRSAKVFELARRNPKAFGLSHVAQCEVSMNNGREVVEEIHSVDSVDIVADPATNKGLFEGRRNAVKKKFREVLEAIRPKLEAAKAKEVRKFLLLSEDDDMMGAVMDVEVEEPGADDGDHNAKIDEGFKAAIDAAWNQYLESHDIDAFLDTIEKYAEAHFNLQSDGGSDEGSEDDSDEPKSEAVGDGSGKQKAQQRAMHAKDPPEHDEDGDVIGWKRRSAKRRGRKGKKRESAGDPLREALAVCSKINYRPDVSDLDIIAATPAENRQAVAERLKKASEATEPKFMSQGRDQFTTPATTKKATESKEPATLADDWIK